MIKLKTKRNLLCFLVAIPRVWAALHKQVIATQWIKKMAEYNITIVRSISVKIAEKVSEKPQKLDESK